MSPRLSPVRVGIAGLGRSGWDIHAAMLTPLKTKYRIVAAFDPDAARVAQARERFRCLPCSSFDDLIAAPDVELVVVATPSHLHADQSILALKAGKHVVCEKPMAGSVRDADRMIAASRRTGQLLTVFQNRRYAKDFQEVLRVLRSGVLGRIVHVRIAYHGFSRRWDWQTLKKFNGGSLNNTGPHALDQALILFGDRKPSVFCLRDRALTLGDADDHVKVVLHRKGSPTVEVEITSACPYPQESWCVMGTQGGLAGSSKALRWKFFDVADLPPRSVTALPTPDRSYNWEELPTHECAWTEAEDKGPGPQGFYLDLFDSIRKQKPLAISPESVRRQMWLLDECRRLAPI